MVASIKQQWFSNVRADILSGMTVALALIPEALAFSIIAGVDPMVGLYASFCMAIVIAFTGGRPAMISAATGAMSLLMINLVKDHGIEYLFAATVLTGIIQILLGVLKVGRFLSFLPQTVMIGFVNALGILIFTAQLPHFQGANWMMYAMVAGTLLIVYLFPLMTKAIPSPLVAIVLMTIVAIVFHLDLKTVGDMGNITRSLPVLHFPKVDLSVEMLLIILPYSLPLAIVGLLESMLTATVLDEITDTPSNKNKEARGQGIANMVTGFFGGMAGCAMIGQSMINVKSGGRGRLSTLVAGVFLLFLIMVLGDVVKQIPMAALVGVMFMVAAGTFDWQSLKGLTKYPLSDAIVMVVTVVIVLFTHNLALGVMVGIVLSTIVFGWKMAKIKTTSQTEGNMKQYRVSGQLFFATISFFMDEFQYETDPDTIIIDFSSSHIWDQSAVIGISKIIDKYERLNKKVIVKGLNEDSKKIVRQIGITSLSNK
ncbi:SulP family inorganic anion transporter [Priestia sp. JV24]|uniref:SulP family inorganic anion transporter n=1 Tax=Priestia TaxID=2800373 RepID=UPI0021D65DC5|nr:MULTISPECIES: SulP family inorganic anion transporter [Priestia]MCU7707901.1 SulP family inorganic anion transporter [Priestia megaterium]MCW1047526.1 SulP family inorganic anion transporter [Priestia sp. JV24]